MSPSDCSGEIRSWPDLGSQSVGNFRIFQLRSVRRRSPRNGVERDFYVMDCSDWVNVIAITAENELILVEQFRHGVATVELEVPGGIMDPGETDPVAAGLRELREETGYEGEGAIEIGCVLPNSAIQSNRCRTVLVRNCRRVGELELDDSEDIAVRLFPASEISKLVTEGSIRHSLAVAALYHYELWSRSAQSPTTNGWVGAIGCPLSNPSQVVTWIFRALSSVWNRPKAYFRPS